MVSVITMNLSIQLSRVINDGQGIGTAATPEIGGLMHSTQTLNLGLSGSPEESQEVPRSSGDEFAEMRELIDQTRSEVRRTQMELDRQQDADESHRRVGKILALGLGILILVLAGASWIAYPVLRDQRNSLPQLVGLQNGAKALADRIDSAQAKADAANGLLSTLAGHIDQFETSTKASLQAARSQAESAAAQVGQRLREDLNKSMQVIQSRMAGVESNQREASEHVTQLEQQIAGLKQQIATMREESSAANEKVRQLEDEQQARTKAISGLDQRMASHQAALSTLVNRTDRQRIEFDVENRRTREITPGIYLTIRRADVANQEVDGTLQLSAQSRMLPIRGQGVQKPMIFYASDEKRPMELVLTNIAKNRVSGYLSMPVPVTVGGTEDNGGH
jgi:chromosome segregation ATPase